MHDPTKKMFSRDSAFIVDGVIGTKFGNCNIYIKKVTETSILSGFDQKGQFFGVLLLVQSQYFGTGTRHGFEILHHCD